MATNILEIILTDDDPDDRLLFRDMLAKQNHPATLIEFSGSMELEKYLASIEKVPPPDMIFLDINMPLKNGIECLRDIRRREAFCNLPVIMFTVSAKAADIDESFNCGANLYIRKAYSIEEGKGTLQKIFDDYFAGSLMKTPRDKYYIED